MNAFCRIPCWESLWAVSTGGATCTVGCCTLPTPKRMLNLTAPNARCMMTSFVPNEVKKFARRGLVGKRHKRTFNGSGGSLRR